MNAILLTLLQVVINIAGVALVRSAVMNKPLNSFGQIVSATLQPKLIGGLALIVLGFFVTVVILSKYKLSHYQPLSSGLTFVVTLIVSYFFLHEQITLTTLGGIFLIMIGCLLISL